MWSSSWTSARPRQSACTPRPRRRQRTRRARGGSGSQRRRAGARGTPPHCRPASRRSRQPRPPRVAWHQECRARLRPRHQRGTCRCRAQHQQPLQPRQPSSPARARRPRGPLQPWCLQAPTLPHLHRQRPPCPPLTRRPQTPREAARESLWLQSPAPYTPRQELAPRRSRALQHCNPAEASSTAAQSRLTWVHSLPTSARRRR
mmetsp:Transcript_30306/g.96900  ORF Transcript_30306/g.96900 Transcript_30306/m.96900 type:complete len:203 (-) Transcript_30306:105-713(-)